MIFPWALACRERENKWAPFKVHAKKDRKTLDFECILTEDSHRVNLAALMAQRDTSRWGDNLYIDYEAKVNLFMAVPGMQSGTKVADPSQLVIQGPCCARLGACQAGTASDCCRAKWSVTAVPGGTHVHVSHHHNRTGTAGAASTLIPFQSI